MNPAVQINIDLDGATVESIDTAMNALSKLKEEKERKRKVREFFNGPSIKVQDIVKYKLLSQSSRESILTRLKNCGVTIFDSPKSVATGQLKNVMSLDEKLRLGIK